MKLKIGLVLVLLASTMLTAQKQIDLKTGNSQVAVLINIGCEGANCVGKTVDATAGGITLTSASYNPTVTDQPAGFSQAQKASCYNTGAKIWVTDNTAITLATGRGKAIQDGGVFDIYGFTAISNFKAIRDAAVSSTLYCDYYRQP